MKIALWRFLRADKSVRATISSVMKPAFIMAFVVALPLAFPVAAKAVDIKEVTSPTGIKALLVEDYTVPIISMSFSIKGGTTQDPIGKEGAMKLMASMLDEGAGDMDNKKFQTRAEEIGAEMGFSVTSDQFSGNIRMLKQEEAASFGLLSAALNEPRFDPKPIERIRAAMKDRIVRNRFHPGVLAGKALRTSLYGDHPYSRESGGTLKSLDAISRDDLLEMKNKQFSSENLSIGVVGAISPEELGKRLDELFGKWPKKSEITKISEAKMHFGDHEHINLDTPQATVQMMFPGLKRDNPDFFATHLMVHILGGGTFSSWLFDEVREKRGLVYSINSWVSTKDHAGSIGIAFSTRADQSKEAIDLVLKEVDKMANKGPSEEELEAAKKYVFGSYAINNLDNSTSISRVLVTLQSEKLGVDYLDKREQYINNVTLEDVKRVAKKYLSVKPTIVVVGPASS